MSNIQLSLYSLNKSMIGKLPTLTDEDIEKIEDKFRQYLSRTGNTYYMLLSNDLKYYTMFQKNSMANKNFFTEFIGCLQDLGEIKAIEFDDNNQIECWVLIDGSAEVLYMFAYDQGVILCS